MSAHPATTSPSSVAPQAAMQSAPISIEAAKFRAAMSNLGGACCVITTRHAGHRAGLTATAVCSVSATPPRLLVCVNKETYAYELIKKQQQLAVNVLGTDQQSVAKRFAGMVAGVHGEARFEDDLWKSGVNGVPVLDNALSAFQCQVFMEIPSGTHAILICDVLNSEANLAADSALAYFKREFISLETKPQKLT